MCGICFSLRWGDADNEQFEDLSRKLQVANAARGPDAQGLHKAYVKPAVDPSSHLVLEFYASELRLRGEGAVVQPHEKDDDVLCWNGEIFDGMDISPEENDGARLFEQLRRLDTPGQIRDLFASIEGPYAFVYYQASSQRLFFARDPLGRRSLLIHKPSPASPYFLLASVSAGADPRYEFDELSTEHIYCLDIHRITRADELILEIPAMARRASSTDPSKPFAEPSKVNPSMPSPEESPSVTALDQKRHAPCAEHTPSIGRKGHARLAVLFSGGIDSTVITFLAHRYIPLDEPIDLLNVAFENPRKVKMQAEGNLGGVSKKQRKARERAAKRTDEATCTSYDVPDRVTGLQEVEELRRLCPERIWNFVEINVPYEESQSARPTIESLMWPARTVMDMSLALALYFASQGAGQVRNSPGAEPISYASTARVLLNGLGSDELLGGYGRHRTAYNTGGWQSVIEELQLEIDRIPTRNLGRDDRVISSHGKETRHPFLSLVVLDFLARLPVNQKMDPRSEVGLGDKMLLRLAARKLGLVEASQRKKRAMQFGSHSARMDGERRGDMLLE
ncbi:putative asparagine synthase [Lyophyllum shimeji]|uniref:Asparagine synthase n=1 Tax=Lyophyllum shimeji TaxID=47721 RepID=A0A9P3PI42_LYOSH|nr:putative asparagine synthase [Lyophyllum shimeji]